MKEKIKIEELNGMELLKLIYGEVKNVRKELNEKMENVHKKIENVHKELDIKINNVHKELDIKINNVHKELDIKINNVYKELNNKIDNTKNILVAEISDELKTFYEVSEKTTNNLEEKIKNEIEDRKIDVSKIKEFNKIIINDIRGRVSILEEESEKYNLK